MRLVDHFIVGGTGGLAAGRRAAVMDPNNGGQQAEVVLGGADAPELGALIARTARSLHTAWFSIDMTPAEHRPVH